MLIAQDVKNVHPGGWTVRQLLQAEGLLYGGHAVQLFPAEELHYLVLSLDRDGLGVGLAAHVTIGGGGGIDGILQVKTTDDAGRGKIKEGLHLFCNLAI